MTYEITMNEHNGTHLDAPAHFISDDKPHAHVTIERVPLTSLMGRGARLACRDFKENDYVSKSFVTDCEAQHGAVQASDIAVFDFGWAARWGLPPHDGRYFENWPGVSMEAGEYLLEKSVAAIGVDTFSPHPPAALAQNSIHPVVLEKQVLIIENLRNE